MSGDGLGTSQTRLTAKTPMQTDANGYKHGCTEVQVQGTLISLLRME